MVSVYIQSWYWWRHNYKVMISVNLGADLIYIYTYLSIDISMLWWRSCWSHNNGVAVMISVVQKQWPRCCNSDDFSSTNDHLRNDEEEDLCLVLEWPNSSRVTVLVFVNWNLYKKNFFRVFLSKSERFWPSQKDNILCSCPFCFGNYLMK